MHDQIDCSPIALATGIDWSTVVGGDPGDDDVEVIEALQKQCSAGGFKDQNGNALVVDGVLGSKTQFALEALAKAAAASSQGRSEET